MHIALTAFKSSKIWKRSLFARESKISRRKLQIKTENASTRFIPLTTRISRSKLPEIPQFLIWKWRTFHKFLCTYFHFIIFVSVFILQVVLLHSTITLKLLWTPVSLTNNRNSRCTTTSNNKNNNNLLNNSQQQHAITIPWNHKIKEEGEWLTAKRRRSLVTRRPRPPMTHQPTGWSHWLIVEPMKWPEVGMIIMRLSCKCSPPTCITPLHPPRFTSPPRAIPTTLQLWPFLRLARPQEFPFHYARFNTRSTPRLLLRPHPQKHSLIQTCSALLPGRRKVAPVEAWLPRKEGAELRVLWEGLAAQAPPPNRESPLRLAVSAATCAAWHFPPLLFWTTTSKARVTCGRSSQLRPTGKWRPPERPSNRRRERYNAKFVEYRSTPPISCRLIWLVSLLHFLLLVLDSFWQSIIPYLCLSNCTVLTYKGFLYVKWSEMKLFWWNSLLKKRRTKQAKSVWIALLLYISFDLNLIISSRNSHNFDLSIVTLHMKEPVSGELTHVIPPI